MTTTSAIGSTLHVVAASPSTYDSTGFAALTWTAEVGNVVSMSEYGDQNADVQSTLLKTGRVWHSNGAKDGGEVTVTCDITAASDTGLDIVRSNVGTDTEVSFRITDVNGDVTYLAGIVSSYRIRERNVSNPRGLTFGIRPNHAVVEVAA